jgi:hypothetical protein
MGFYNNSGADGSTQSSWQSGDKFFEHISWLSQKMAEARFRFNNSSAQDIDQRLNGLDDWLESVDSLFLRITGFLSDEQLSMYTSERDQIYGITKGQCIVDYTSIKTDEIMELHSHIRLLEFCLFTWMAELRMLLPINKVITFDDEWELHNQIDY